MSSGEKENKEMKDTIRGLIKLYITTKLLPPPEAMRDVSYGYHVWYEEFYPEVMAKMERTLDKVARELHKLHPKL